MTYSYLDSMYSSLYAVHSREYWEAKVWTKVVPPSTEPRCFFHIFRGDLPKDFQFWDIRDSQGFSAAYRLAEQLLWNRESFSEMLDKEFWLAPVGAIHERLE